MKKLLGSLITLSGIAAAVAIAFAVSAGAGWHGKSVAPIAVAVGVEASSIKAGSAVPQAWTPALAQLARATVPLAKATAEFAKGTAKLTYAIAFAMYTRNQQRAEKQAATNAGGGSAKRILSVDNELIIVNQLKALDQLG